MKEIHIEDKQQYLNEHYLFVGVPKITDKMECIHCNQQFIVGDYKVYKAANGFEFICCPFAPECNGTLIDWIRVKRKYTRKKKQSPPDIPHS